MQKQGDQFRETIPDKREWSTTQFKNRSKTAVNKVIAVSLNNTQSGKRVSENNTTLRNVYKWRSYTEEERMIH